jgi:hypothetical protein
MCNQTNCLESGEAAEELACKQHADASMLTETLNHADRNTLTKKQQSHLWALHHIPLCLD